MLLTIFVLLAGTPEAGGWTMRELKRVLRGLAGLNIVYVNPQSKKKN
jgi:arginase family enzyme